jgi:hypothetical protein
MISGQFVQDGNSDDEEIISKQKNRKDAKPTKLTKDSSNFDDSSSSSEDEKVDIRTKARLTEQG